MHFLTLVVVVGRLIPIVLSEHYRWAVGFKGSS